MPFALKMSLEQDSSKNSRERESNKDLVERRAITSRGGTILAVIAFSRNFHMIGTWLSQQIWETRSWASSTDGKETPAELRVELNWTAQSSGSQFLSCADFVSSNTVSHKPAIPCSWPGGRVETAMGDPKAEKLFLRKRNRMVNRKEIEIFGVCGREFWRSLANSWVWWNCSSARKGKPIKEEKPRFKQLKWIHYILTIQQVIESIKLKLD